MTLKTLICNQFMLVYEEIKNFIDEFNIRNANSVNLISIENNKVTLDFSNETLIELFKDRISDEINKSVTINKIEKLNKKTTATFHLEEKKTFIEEFIKKINYG